MKPVLIKIDLSSIKKNPRAGETRTRVRLGYEVKVEGFGATPDWAKLFNCEDRSLFHRFHRNSKPHYQIIISTDNLSTILKMIKKNGDGRENCVVKCLSEEVFHPQVPLYSFSFENINIKCPSCGGIFKSNDFRSDEYGDGGLYTSTGCPLCDTPDCCDVIYESIEDALKRGNIDPDKIPMSR